MKSVLITGCSSGYGLQTALHFHDKGWNVIASMRTPRPDILPKSDRMHIVALDVTRPESVAAAIEAAGPIDVLVNNAGVYEFAPLDGITAENFHKQFDVNVLGLLLVTQEAARHFNPNGGSVVNISSGISTLAPPNAAIYTATKASVDAVTSSLAKELAPRKIRVNAVNPGMVATEGVVSAGLHEGDMRKWVESVTPLGRIGTVEEIAAVVAFFASEDASYITGETLHVTGGGSK